MKKDNSFLECDVDLGIEASVGEAEEEAGEDCQVLVRF